MELVCAMLIYKWDKHSRIIQVISGVAIKQNRRYRISFHFHGQQSDGKRHQAKRRRFLVFWLQKTCSLA
jgi:hypothetical protein